MTAARLLGIGEFARLGGVSIKALRIYAELGLLEPAMVNPQSRYRLYTRSQLSILHRILSLKSVGLSLSEIRGQRLTCDESSLEQVRARLLARAEVIQRQLLWIDAEIRSSSPVVVKRVPRLAAWSHRQAIDSYDQADALLSDLGRQAPPAARLTSGAVWHECGHGSGRIDCEVFWIAARATRTGAPGALGPATVASILHEGDESTIHASYDAVRRWLRDHRYHISGPNRELYLGASLTEIQFPIN